MNIKIDENLIFKLSTDKIKINKDLPRQRKDLGKIQALVESIETFGQLQPIVINRDNELIAGGRRLAACTLLNTKVKACYKDTLDPVLMRELELEENLQRKDLTPAEECFAIKELVELKQKKYGTPQRGKKGGFTLTNAAETINKTKGNVIEAIQIAEMLQDFPDLQKAKTKSEIKKSYKGLQRVAKSIDALKEFKQTEKSKKRYTLVNQNALDHMVSIEDNSVDILFTDPPYGIDIDKLSITVGRKTGGDLTTTGIKYDDSKANSENLYKTLAEESYRFTKDTAHALIFCAPSQFETVKHFFEDAEWVCSPRPVIWIKGNSGQNNQPTKWFSSAYEILLFVRKPLSTLQILGKPDWIQCNIVKDKIHQAEKPLPLLKELITRIAIPGYTLYDPFAGSGAILEAACDLNIKAVGCELAIESYSIAINRMNKWEKANEKKI